MGSRFYHSAPLQKGEVTPETPEEKIWVHGGRETVLIVDDDTLIRQMAEDTLRGMGLNPVSAKNAHDALEILKVEIDELGAKIKRIL